MNPELLQALSTIVDKPVEVEYRVYYDNQGKVVGFSESDHPAVGNYIVISDPAEFHNTNTLLLRVVDNKLTKINPNTKVKQGIQRSTQGQPVVKGIAALAIMPGETYTDIEYYDRKSNN